MMLPVVLWISILVQFAAAYFALRLIGVTHRLFGWILIATAISLMAGRKLIVFFHWYFGDLAHPPDIRAEMVGMFISLFMLIGLAWVAPMFSSIQKSKESLAESERNFRSLFNSTFEGIVVHDGDIILQVNQTSANIFGFEKDAMIGRPILEFIASPSHDAVLDHFLNGSETPFEAQGIKANGEKVFIEIVGKPFTYQGQDVQLAALRDFTRRRTTEVALQESEIRFRSIFENAVIGLYKSTPDGRIILANPAMVRMLGYGNFDQLAENNLNSISQCAGYPRSDFIDQIENDGTVIGMESQWITRDGNTLHVRESARVIRDRQGRPLYYEGTLEDISQRKKAEKALETSMEQLQKAMAGTIEAMGLIQEWRDPYTAGHQRKVSQLASAVATEMELSHYQLDAIKMAALVHDLGKISVPVEILAKSGKLNEIESIMIKNQSQIGQEILKTIDFPWPVAEIVAQHQERYDGSGHPEGLIGDEIMIEARILAVADVVEAMTSHRPYRPALGIDKALEEIVSNQGTLYDPTVVKACVRLYQDKGFSL